MNPNKMHASLLVVLLSTMLCCCSGPDILGERYVYEDNGIESERTGSIPPVNVPSDVPASYATPSSVEMDCVPFLINDQLRGSGFLIVEDKNSRNFSINMETLEVYPLSDPVDPLFSYQPDSMAYRINNNSDSFLRVQTVEETIDIPWQENWCRIARWMPGKNYLQITGWFDTPAPIQYFVNPFDNSIITITPDFPDVYPFDYQVNLWGGVSYVSYSPDLQYAVYPRLSEGELTFNLVQVEKMEIIVSLSNVYIDKYPVWNSNFFSYAGSVNADEHGGGIGVDLYKVKLDGGVERLTYFSELLEHPNIYAYSWSPDNDDIVYWFSSGIDTDDNSGNLGFMNTEDQESIITCLGVENARQASYPIWDHESSLVIVSADIDSEVSALVLVSPETGTYMIIDTENEYIPKGWLTFKP